MIVVRVELHSAITGQITEIARMDICNEGGTVRKGDYGVYAMRGRDRDTLARRTVQHTGRVVGYPRLAIHVWNLVGAAILACGYTWGAKDYGDEQ